MSENKKKLHSVGHFFKIQYKAFEELWHIYRVKTFSVILLSICIMFGQFAELKFIEYITNVIALYYNNIDINIFYTLIKNTCFFLSFLLLVRVLTNVNNRLLEKYNSDISAFVIHKFNDKVSSISYEYFESNLLYEKINLAKDVEKEYSNAVHGITQIIQIFTMLIIYAVMLSKINVLFVLVLFTTILVSALAASSTTDKQLDFWRANVSPQARRNKYFRDIFLNRINHQNIQTLRAYSFFVEKYHKYNIKEKHNYLKLNIFSITTGIGSSILFLITFGITTIVVGAGVVSGKYDIGYFSMIILLLVNFFNQIARFTNFMLNQNWYTKVLEAYYEILDLEEFDFSRQEIATECNVIIHNLKYKYMQSNSYALKNINLTVKMGEKITIVGENGSGKSTFVSILLGLLNKYEGDLCLEGQVCTAILQDFIQYQMTIKENLEIGCGGKELSQEKIWDILKKVKLYDFVMNLPDGMYTKLGQLEDGIELSKGQWQRLAIGRLLANETANCWILDEPTSYLDPLAEIEMYNLIYELSQERLVFFISHRLGFAPKADRIIVIDNGRIVEDGSHSELIRKKNSKYSRMFEAQKEWYM